MGEGTRGLYGKGLQAVVKEEWREARRNKKKVKEIYKCEAHWAQRAATMSRPSSIHLL